MKLKILVFLIFFATQLNEVKNFQFILKLYNCENHTIDTYDLEENTNLTTLPYYCQNCTSYIIAHGFRDSADARWVERMVHNLFINSIFSNIFLVDWSDVSITSSVFGYETAVKNMNITIREVLQFLRPYAENNYFNVQDTILDIHCIGHSMGAHLCGLVGKAMTSYGFRFV